MKKIKFLALLILSVLLFALCGCGGSGGVPSGYDITVTYYFNGGTMRLYTDLTELTLRYRPGSLVAEPGVSTNQLPEVRRSGYSVGGWYYAETDENGNLVKDENGNPVPSDRKVDFSKDRVEEDITLVIVWAGKIKVFFENVYIMENMLYYYDYETGDPFNNPGIETSVIGTDTEGKAIRKTIEGYYWSYDEATGTYSDPIDFSAGLTFEDLNARIGEDPEKEGDYSVLHVYAKLAD